MCGGDEDDWRSDWEEMNVRAEWSGRRRYRWEDGVCCRIGSEEETQLICVIEECPPYPVVELPACSGWGSDDEDDGAGGSWPTMDVRPSRF